MWDFASGRRRTAGQAVQENRWVHVVVSPRLNVIGQRCSAHRRTGPCSHVNAAAASRFVRRAVRRQIRVPRYEFDIQGDFGASVVAVLALHVRRLICADPHGSASSASATRAVGSGAAVSYIQPSRTTGRLCASLAARRILRLCCVVVAPLGLGQPVRARALRVIRRAAPSQAGQIALGQSCDGNQSASASISCTTGNLDLRS